MSIPYAVHTAHLSLWWHCRDCDTAPFGCPSCGDLMAAQRPHHHPPGLPMHRQLVCESCGAGLSIAVTGYRPNPTGEAAGSWPLSDPLPPRKAKPQAATQQRPRPAAALPPAEPCPPAAERHRLNHWRRVGFLPDGVEPATIAAAYRRRFRVEPYRDGQTRTYTGRELGLSLGELGLAPPPNPLAVIWERALQELPPSSPTFRSLISQQARLVALEPSTYKGRSPGELVARVIVQNGFLSLVRRGIDQLGNALGDALGQVVAVELVEVGE